MQETEELGRERHLVVVFDICSSTTILEDLKRTDNLAAWRDLLLDMKANLQEEGSRLAMCLYKFIGDGWVLLFPDSVPKKELCGFLSRFSEWYQRQFESAIRPLLLQEPSPIGLMFGIDAGRVDPAGAERAGGISRPGDQRGIEAASADEGFARRPKLQGAFFEELVQFAGSAAGRDRG